MQLQEPNDCLLFTWVNRSVHGLSRISSRNRTHEFHLPKKPPRNGETGIKDGFEETEHGFPFGILRPGKLDYVNFLDVMFLSGIFHRHDPTSRVPFTFHTDF